ncbi:MAG: hypothetical protein GX613_03455 [Chloroflexi bacterium]|nr:hypothetical protein [Chloroflexota bacterium]
MTPLEADTAQWTKQIQDALAGHSGMREGLTDDEALPLVNWGAEQAGTVAQHLAEGDAPPPDNEQIANVAYTLGRFLTRLTWVVTYRAKKDGAWLTRTFAKINALSQELFGPDAPTLSDEEIAAWIAEQPNRSNGELLNDLIARFTPGGASAPVGDAPADESPTPDAPADKPPANDPPADEQGASHEPPGETPAEPASSPDESNFARDWRSRLFRALSDEPPADPHRDSPPTQGNDDV